MGDNQRRFSRTPLEVSFRCRDEAGLGELTFQGGDLSEGGAFLKSELLLEAGELLTLQFDIPGASRRVHAQGRIAWVRRFPRVGEPAGMGVEFLGLAEADRVLLVEHLTNSPR